MIKVINKIVSGYLILTAPILTILCFYTFAMFSIGFINNESLNKSFDQIIIFLAWPLAGLLGMTSYWAHLWDVKSVFFQVARIIGMLAAVPAFRLAYDFAFPLEKLNGFVVLVIIIIVIPIVLLFFRAGKATYDDLNKSFLFRSKK